MKASSIISHTLLVAMCLTMTSVAAIRIQHELDLATVDTHCTTVIAGKGATHDGSTMVTHTADCKECDFRLFKVPAMDHANDNAERPVFPWYLDYPRYIGDARGPGYSPINGQRSTEALGTIPQKNRTYAYFDAAYGIMNEKQLIIGESTCGARILSKRKGDGDGKALVDISELTRVAMEQCDTAQCAVDLIGATGEKFGYYGPPEGGETLTIIDPDEAWVLHMLGDGTDTSAVWAAQRVPDDQVAAVANAFVIREMDLNDTANFRASANVHDIALQHNFWDGKSEFDFTLAFANQKTHHAHYSTRRVWRVFSLLGHDDLTPFVDGPLSKEYPFAVKPKEKVSIQKLLEINRDYYQGTQFDLSKGMAAGAFGTPNRWEGAENEKAMGEAGSWERPISMFRTSYSFAAQARGFLPDHIGGVTWFGYDAPHSTVYVPFYAGMTKIPESYSTGSLLEFSRESAFWAFDFVSNWADLRFNAMIEDIRLAQTKLESKAFAVQSALEKAVSELGDDEELAIEYLTDYAYFNAKSVVEQWWKFADHLVAKYNDGYRNEPAVGTAIGYPTWWLEDVGFDHSKPKN